MVLGREERVGGGWEGALPKGLQAAAAPLEPQGTTHLIGKVRHDEGRVGHAGFLEVLAARVPVVQLLSPVLVSSFRDLWNHRTRCFVTRKKGTKR